MEDWGLRGERIISIKDIETSYSELLRVCLQGVFWADMHWHFLCSKLVQPMEPLGVQQRTEALPHTSRSVWCILNRLGRLNSEETLTLRSLSCLGPELLSPAQVVAVPERALCTLGTSPGKASVPNALVWALVAALVLKISMNVALDVYSRKVCSRTKNSILCPGLTAGHLGRSEVGVRHLPLTARKE